MVSSGYGKKVVGLLINEGWHVHGVGYVCGGGGGGGEGGATQS